MDANTLLYAANSADPHHEEARGWLDRSLGERETVGFAWLVLTAFLRLSTRQGLFPRPLPVPSALQLVRSWTGGPCATLVEPTPRHLHVLAGLLRDVGTGGNLVNDAHLAALALEHDATVVTYDNDFDRFPGIRWRRPG